VVTTTKTFLSRLSFYADYLFGANGVNTSPDTGKYTTTTNPRNVGLALRLDF